MTATPEQAEAFVRDSTFVWYQRFQLVPGVWTPGTAGTVDLVDALGVPDDLTGARVLDVGTTNGGCAFTLERRGAEVTAVDIVDEHTYGFRAIADLLGSRVRFLQASVYELPGLIDEPFDLILLLGVIYHLRHPLLALDRLRQIARGRLLLESAVAGDADDAAGARFFRHGELAGDPTNWFAPNLAGLTGWVESAGFAVDSLSRFPADGPPQRAALAASVKPGQPEYLQVSYERPVTSVTLG